MNLDRLGQLVRRHVALAAEGIALALHDQGRRLQAAKVLDAEPLGPADRMKRIPKANQSRDASFVGHEAGNSASHRLAADDQVFGAELLDNLQPGFTEYRLAVWRPLLAGLATLA
jgi:hypothetical protein